MNTMSPARYAKLAQERGRREREAIACYRPFAAQEPVHRSTAKEKIVYGGKRSSKTVVTSFDVVSIILGINITAEDGSIIPISEPVSTPDAPLNYWVIGWDVKHIGQTLHKILFKPGMGGTFRCIRDLNTGLMRIWNRANPLDVERRAESMLTEPLIPERFIKSWVWSDPAANVFESVEFTNGAQLFAFPSSARNPKQGDAVAGIWVDEDIQNYTHLAEWQDRLTDYNGWFRWSVWPHGDNPAVEEMLDRAEETKDEPNPTIQSFRLIMTDNPYIPQEGKDAAIQRMGTAENIASRNAGDLGVSSSMMYDYVPFIHCIRKSTAPVKERPTDPMGFLSYWYSRYGRFPMEWTRYLSIDPSFTRTASHCWVVPPAEWEGISFSPLVICEWECLGVRMGPKRFAKELRPKMQGSKYEAFVMDKNMGRQTRVGSDDGDVFHAYAEAFELEGLRSRQTLNGFIPGCNITATRYRCVRDMLDIQDRKTPQILFAEECYETIKEFNSYRRKVISVGVEKVTLDEPRNPRKHDCMASLEYFATFIQPMLKDGNAYVDPTAYGNAGSPAYRAAMKLRKKNKDAGFGDYVHLGAGAVA